MSIAPIEQVPDFPVRSARANKKYPIDQLEVGQGVWAHEAKAQVLRSLAYRYGRKLGRKYRVGTAIRNDQTMAFLRREK